MSVATPLKAGDSFPEGVTFTYIPYTPEKASLGACGLPIKYDASKEFKNKKVVVVAVPGAFTPTCTERHLPGFLEKKEELKAKGVDNLIIIAYNDAFVMSAWGKANGVQDDYTLFMSDDGLKFSKPIGWYAGDRTARYALIVDHGKVTYAEKETAMGALDVSGVDAVLSKL
ncbi:hypothetical protein NKR23_g1816 [Pleurostoma richardsiae]|uniref:Thioredoxin peroxidase n=1 Tax=Pleurostoma richardsiae TaxID=41990 RepID=A0AA38RZ13_9PEZI|nr:hypothetical protein NKR23_g1816 [Pleurostoma richardsiae]